MIFLLTSFLESVTVGAIKPKDFLRERGIVNKNYILYICISYIFSCPAMTTNPAASDFLKKYETGFSLLRDAIHDANILMPLHDDGTFLRNFPFESYTLKLVSDLGYIYLDELDDCIKNVLRKNSAWETKYVPYIKDSIIPGTVVIDIGAHIGTHTLTMSRSVGPNGIVIAFEPQEKIFRELYMNMLANDCNNVIPIRCAIGNCQKIMKIRQDVPGNEGASYLMPHGIGRDVVTVRLDDFNFTNVSFIKIDTENTEFDVLQGARKTIAHNKPIILIEIQANDVRAKRNREDMRKEAMRVKQLIEELDYDLTLISWAEYLATPRK